jgi:hypothetical protein
MARSSVMADQLPLLMHPIIAAVEGSVSGVSVSIVNTRSRHRGIRCTFIRAHFAITICIVHCRYCVHLGERGRSGVEPGGRWVDIALFVLADGPPGWGDPAGLPLHNVLRDNPNTMKRLGWSKSNAKRISLHLRFQYPTGPPQARHRRIHTRMKIVCSLNFAVFLVLPSRFGS